MDLGELGESLWKDQDETNWKRFGAALKKGKARYYRVNFEKGKVQRVDDLRKSYAEIFDSKAKLIAKIPIFRKEGKKIRGSLIYLKGLTKFNGE
jgi:hypothetical protein